MTYLTKALYTDERLGNVGEARQLEKPPLRLLNRKREYESSKTYPIWLARLGCKLDVDDRARAFARECY